MRLRSTLVAGSLALVAVLVATAGAGQAQAPDPIPPMITVLDPAKETRAIISTGESLSGGYEFGSIPDGIAFRTRGQGRIDVFVNHETSTVPFPFSPPFGDTATPPAVDERNQNDFDNSQVSHLIFNRQNGRLLTGRYAIDSNENFHRFCSSYLATEKEGFDRPVYFANEEAQDWVFRSGTSWPGPTFITPGTPGAEQTGVVVALDTRNGKRHVIYGMGRHNHENDVAIPGYDDLVVLSGDDTFFTTQLAEPYKPAWSQLYGYIAPDTNALLKDEGELWAFVSDTPGYDDYFDFEPGDDTEIEGHFIKVPKDVARGKRDGVELLSTTAGYTGMLPPPSVSGAPPDGPQWVLDQWGNANINDQDTPTPGDGENVFRFVRLEDIAYDKNDPNVVYIADTGRASLSTATPPAPAKGLSTNGRIWKMVLDEDDPTVVESLSILIEGDDHLTAAQDLAGAFHEIHQPDNIDTTANGSLLVTEDPSTNNQYSLPRGDNETPARLWRIDLDAADPDADAARVTAAEVDQALDERPGYDVDGPQTTPPTLQPARLGVWESSGVIDASSIFGPGAYLITIQAHSLWIEKADGPDAIGPPPPENAGKDFTFKREGGQLALIYLDPTW
jgi:Bacterial protein of unknown function (DUF839)